MPDAEDNGSIGWSQDPKPLYNINDSHEARYTTILFTYIGFETYGHI
jgi:hypothetical protein